MNDPLFQRLAVFSVDHDGSLSFTARVAPFEAGGGGSMEWFGFYMMLGVLAVGAIVAVVLVVMFVSSKRAYGGVCEGNVGGDDGSSWIGMSGMVLPHDGHAHDPARHPGIGHDPTPGTEFLHHHHHHGGCDHHGAAPSHPAPHGDAHGHGSGG